MLYRTLRILLSEIYGCQVWFVSNKRGTLQKNIPLYVSSYWLKLRPPFNNWLKSIYDDTIKRNIILCIYLNSIHLNFLYLMQQSVQQFVGQRKKLISQQYF